MRTRFRVALCSLGLFACGAKTGLRVPDVLPACEAGIACEEPTTPPLEQPTQRTLAPPSTARDTWCARATGVEDFRLPPGFCMHLYARVRGVRVLAPARDARLFVSAPSRPVPAGSPPGAGEITLLTDDDRDGTAEQHSFFRADDVHGLALAGEHLYFTRAEALYRLTVRPAARRANPDEAMRVATFPRQDGRWTHAVAVRSDGRVFISFSPGTINPAAPSNDHGAIYEVLSGGSVRTWSRGFRNPLYVRCHPTQPHCLSSELGMDQARNANDKIVEVTPCAHYGYPHCHGRDRPWHGDAGAPAGERCEWPTHEIITMRTGATPFGFDWEPGSWPEPLRGRLFLAQHGWFYGSVAGEGAGVYVATIDACSQRPTNETRLFMESTAVSSEFPRRTRRPADVAFGPDGRLFVADDQSGSVYWVAPTSLRR